MVCIRLKVHTNVNMHLACAVCVQSEAEKLQRLKERVETQEAKLKKIRAMRGQVDYSKLINGNLCEPKHIAEMITMFLPCWLFVLCYVWLFDPQMCAIYIKINSHGTLTFFSLLVSVSSCRD